MRSYSLGLALKGKRGRFPASSAYCPSGMPALDRGAQHLAGQFQAKHSK